MSEQNSINMSVASEPDGLEGQAALQLLVTTTQQSTSQSKLVVKCNLFFSLLFLLCSSLPGAEHRVWNLMYNRGGRGSLGRWLCT